MFPNFEVGYIPELTRGNLYIYSPKTKNYYSSVLTPKLTRICTNFGIGLQHRVTTFFITPFYIQRGEGVGDFNSRFGCVWIAALTKSGKVPFVIWMSVAGQKNEAALF